MGGGGWELNVKHWRRGGSGYVLTSCDTCGGLLHVAEEDIVHATGGAALTSRAISAYVLGMSHDCLTHEVHVHAIVPPLLPRPHERETEPASSTSGEMRRALAARDR